MCFPTDVSLSLLEGTSLLVPETSKFKVLKCYFQLARIMGVLSNISFSKLHDFLMVYNLRMTNIINL